MADIAPQNERTLAVTTTAVVLVLEMREPMVRERMNCARKTIQDTMAMSVPIPRTYNREAIYTQLVATTGLFKITFRNF